MGNSGSVPNLQNDGVHSEINTYSTQQYFKRTSGGAKNKNYHPQIQNPPSYNEYEMRGLSADKQHKPTFKVLPQSTESLKLRATTNGAILHAGGTISCRPKEILNSKSGSVSLDRKNDPALYPIRRSHTLIIDGHRESFSQRNSAPPLTEFRRSQTILHVAYKKSQSQENNSPQLGDCKTGLSQTTENAVGTTLKMNKYNKKRKAPSAPTNIITDGSNTFVANSVPALEAKTACLAKPRIYATNSNKSGNGLHQLQLRLRPTSSHASAPFQRGSHVRSSTSAPLLEQSNESCLNKNLYRREKSFDAVLLNPKPNHECYDRIPLLPINIKRDQEHKREQQLKIENRKNEAAPRQTIDISRENKLARKPVKRAPNKIPSTLKIVDRPTNILPLNLEVGEALLRDGTSQEKLPSHDLKNTKTKHDNHNYQKVENSAPVIEKKTKVQPTRIPQLKRTFYFGMETTKFTQHNNSKSNADGMNRNEKEVEHLNLHRHSLEIDEEIEDNGILVHVRPTLPKRQPETPTFSPTAAWRNLLEDQQHLDYTRARLKSDTCGNKSDESPICLIYTTKDNNTSTPITWTPQQDLEDEDEEEISDKDKQNEQNLSHKTDSKPEKRSTANSLHIFSLSLPRDAHLQGQLKTSLDCTETNGPVFKSANCWMLPGFNSLQKFKTTLSGGVNSTRKCTCPKGLVKRGINNQPDNIFQTIFGETFATDPYNHGEDCELYKTHQSTPSCHNQNWVLHKSKLNESSLLTSQKTSPNSFLPANRNSQFYMQPKSLTNVCVGKHVMYLPGQEVRNTVPESTATLKRQRQEMSRESLQDPLPVQDIQKSNARTPEKNTHRFSFQSTVRVLEKRKLAEKLSKDAEIQEAQRLHELEAMKRVEEDFQRKRAQEKANIRNLLRIHLNSNLDHEVYRSLPLNINDRYENPHQQSDTNNNISCRAEPDGAVSPLPLLSDNLDEAKHYNFPMSFTNPSEMRRFESDYEESEIETLLPDFQRTALLLEPYLQSII